MPDTIGERLRRLRIAHGWSIRRLAHTANVSLSSISAVESGTRQGGNLTLNTGKRLARALGVSLDVIAGTYEADVPETHT